VSKEGNHRVYRFRRSFHILQGFASITALVLVQTCGPRPLRPEPESVERAAPELIGDFASTLTVISDLSTGLASGLGIRAAPPMNQPNQHHARLRIAVRGQGQDSAQRSDVPRDATRPRQTSVHRPADAPAYGRTRCSRSGATLSKQERPLI